MVLPVFSILDGGYFTRRQRLNARSMN